MLNTLATEHFRALCLQRIEERRTKVAEKKDLLVAVTPQFERALQATKLLGTKPGRGADLLKVASKRRQTKAERLAAQEEEKMEEDENLLLRARVVALEQQLQQSQRVLGPPPGTPPSSYGRSSLIDDNKEF